jgi:multidrug resistance protein
MAEAVVDSVPAAHRGQILAALMVATGIAALDATIVATAVPSIVADVGGFSSFPWVFSIYLLTQAVTVPIYGRLSDLFGRKPILFTGISIFLAGSVLSGSAWSMTTLIAFRGLQGLGAGAIVPITSTIIGDLYSVEERGKAQGYISGVWGIASVLGPTLGGLFSEYASWRWIFFVNIPVGVAALVMLQLHLHERVERRPHRIDFEGAVVLTGALSLGILGLLEGGVSGRGRRRPASVSLPARLRSSPDSSRSSGGRRSRSCRSGSSGGASSLPATSRRSRSAPC